ncbi:MAG: polymorphic toxin type 44 domain-containing protein, partial [Christensenella sp.]
PPFVYTRRCAPHKQSDTAKGADAYVSDIFAGKAQPSDGLTGSAEPGDKFDYTDGDLADEFTQGLFGEEYLRKRFVDKELSKFKPMLEEKASTLEKRIKQKNAGDSSQNARSTVYNDSKGARLLSEEIRPQPTQIPQAGAKTGGVDWSQMWNAAPQYEVAGKKNEANISKNEKTRNIETATTQDVMRVKQGLEQKEIVDMDGYYKNMLSEIEKDGALIQNIGGLLTEGKKLLIFYDWVKPGGKYDIKLQAEYMDKAGHSFDEKGVEFADDVWRNDAMGNIAAGHLAKKMGISLDTLSKGIGLINKSKQAQDEYNQEYDFYPFFGDEPYDYYCYKYGYDLK